MVQHFNLRTTRSVSHISNPPDISSPVNVQHTAGQKPCGAVLQSMLDTSLSSVQSSPQSGLHKSLSITEINSAPTNHSPEEKRFSGSGDIIIITCYEDLYITIIYPGILGPRSDTLSSDIIVNSISRGRDTISLYMYTVCVCVCVCVFRAGSSRNTINCC